MVYLLLGLCLCALICSLLLGWTHLRRRGEVVSCQASAGTCHRREDSSKGECWLHWGCWERMGSSRGTWGAPRYCGTGRRASSAWRGRERKQTTRNAGQPAPGRGAGWNPRARILPRNPIPFSVAALQSLKPTQGAGLRAGAAPAALQRLSRGEEELQKANPRPKGATCPRKTWGFRGNCSSRFLHSGQTAAWQRATVTRATCPSKEANGAAGWLNYFAASNPEV